MQVLIEAWSFELFFTYKNIFPRQFAAASLRVADRLAFDVTTFRKYNMNKFVKFEWDETKRQINLRKHGIDFVDAKTVFAGPTATIPDDRFDYGEARFVTFGLLASRVVAVSHTEAPDSIRIISIRKATRHEQVLYFQSIQDGLEAPRRPSR